jgi:hypothetical protein
MIGALTAIGGLTNIAGSLIGGRARRQEQRAAQADLAQRMSAYENMQFTNPYANLENTAEDLTVNQQQAQFLAQQQQQGLANTMGALQGAAGGSGIAALAQAMSNQQAQNLQQASASIGQQESRNQALSSQQAASNQLMQAQGEARVQDMERGRTETLLGMSQQRLASANAARDAATDQLMQGIGDVAMGGVAGYATNPDDFFQGMLGNSNGPQ